MANLDPDTARHVADAIAVMICLVLAVFVGVVLV